MMYSDYAKRISTMPKERTKQWLKWMLENNDVVQYGSHWFTVKNCKYNTDTRPVYTIFPIRHVERYTELNDVELKMLRAELAEHEGKFVYRNDTDARTLKRLHFNVFESQKAFGEMLAEIAEYDKAILAVQAQIMNDNDVVAPEMQSVGNWIYYALYALAFFAGIITITILLLLL